MKALLTGATGFIGSYVVDQLLERGDVVRALVRPETLAQEKKTTHLRGRQGVELIAGSVTDAAALGRAVKGVDVVYHAALVYERGKPFSPELVAANVEAAEKLLRASVDAHVRRFVFTSSVAVYGWTQPSTVWPLAENASLLGRGNYAKAKAQIETLVRRYHQEHDLEYVNLRPTSTYGPKRPKFERYIAQLLNYPVRSLNPNLVLDTTLEQEMTAHWVHVKDVAAAMVVAGAQPSVTGDAFNIAGERAISRAELIAILHNLTNGFSRISPLLAEAQARHSSDLPIYNIKRAQSVLGFIPQMKIEEGLAEMLATLDFSRLNTRRPALAF